MRRILMSMLGLVSIGCATAPSARRVEVPPPDVSTTAPPVRETTPQRAMPRDIYQTQLPPPPFEDTPILTEPTPEQASFVDTYNRVGRPRISIFIEHPAAEQTQDRDAEWLKSFDDEALRTELTEWLACNGQVTMVAATNQKEADATSDVEVRVQAHPTKQYEDGERIRLLAEAINTKDRVSIGRAFVDIPQPLEQAQINRYTRWLARKLMDDMTASWLAPEPGSANDKSAPPAPPPGASSTPAPQTPPPPPPPTTTPER